MQIQEQVSLAPLHTFSLRNQARKVIFIDSERDLHQLYEEGFFEDPFHLLGEGSNTIFLTDIDTPILKIQIPGIQSFLEEDSVLISEGSDSEAIQGALPDRITSSNEILVTAGAGVSWDEFVHWTVEQQLGGIENLSLIPGTCGAAPVQNIGAYGVELSDVFHSLTCFDIHSGEVKTMSGEECQFRYRDSIFKRPVQQGGMKGSAIILSITLRLSNDPGYHPNLSYKGVLDEVVRRHGATDGSHPTIRQVREAICAIRQSKLPDPFIIPNSGSFFKNPLISSELVESLKARFPDIPQYATESDEVKIPAGWLIEKVGWKGKQIGSVGTWPEQALVVVQKGDAKGEELLHFIQTLQSQVFTHFGIALEPEVNLIQE